MSEPCLPGVQRSRGIERSLPFSARREAAPQLLVHEVRELRANAVDVLHGAAEGVDSMNHIVDGRCHCDPRGGSVFPRGPHKPQRDELGLRPHAESEWLHAVTAENLEGRPPGGEDSRTWQSRARASK